MDGGVFNVLISEGDFPGGNLPIAANIQVAGVILWGKENKYGCANIPHAQRWMVGPGRGVDFPSDSRRDGRHLLEIGSVFSFSLLAYW